MTNEIINKEITLYDINAVAELLKLAPGTVRRMIANRELQHTVIAKNAIRVSAEQLANYIRERQGV